MFDASKVMQPNVHWSCSGNGSLSVDRFLRPLTSSRMLTMWNLKYFPPETRLHADPHFFTDIFPSLGTPCHDPIFLFPCQNFSPLLGKLSHRLWKIQLSLRYFGTSTNGCYRIALVSNKVELLLKKFERPERSFVGHRQTKVRPDVELWSAASGKANI